MRRKLVGFVLMQALAWALVYAGTQIEPVVPLLANIIVLAGASLGILSIGYFAGPIAKWWQQ